MHIVLVQITTSTIKKHKHISVLKGLRLWLTWLNWALLNCAIDNNNVFALGVSESIIELFLSF